MPKGWGSVARRGGRAVTSEPADGVREEARPASAAPEWQPEVWVEEPEPAPARSGKTPASSRPARTATVPDEVESELRSALGPARARRLAPRLSEAVRAYERDRYPEALRALRPLASAAPGVAAVRELLGLTLYRMGRWPAAIGELEAFHALTASLDQHPVLADCHRALGHWRAVEELWDELRRASPSADLVAEGRIVAAGALADRGDLAGAIRMLERSPSSRKRLRPHDLRVSYALADLYERSGDIPRARELMRAIARRDPDFADVSERLGALS